jgi:hypothetical protein
MFVGHYAARGTKVSSFGARLFFSFGAPSLPPSYFSLPFFLRSSAPGPALPRPPAPFVRSRERVMGGCALLVLGAARLDPRLGPGKWIAGGFILPCFRIRLCWCKIWGRLCWFVAAVRVVHQDFKRWWTVSSKGDYQGTPAHLSPVSLFCSICVRSVGFVAVF